MLPPPLLLSAKVLLLPAWVVMVLLLLVMGTTLLCLRQLQLKQLLRVKLEKGVVHLTREFCAGGLIGSKVCVVGQGLHMVSGRQGHICVFGLGPLAVEVVPF